MKKTMMMLLVCTMLLCVACKGSGTTIDAPVSDANPQDQSTKGEETPPVEDVLDGSLFSSISVSVYRDCETVSTRALTQPEELALAEQILFAHDACSAAWPGVEISELESLICLSFVGAQDDSPRLFYVYDANGAHAIQEGEAGMYTILTDELYGKLMQLAGLEYTPAPSTQTLFSSSSYADILAQYADAMRNGYYESLDYEAQDAAFGPNVAFEWRADPKNAYFVIEDLNQDGVGELLIAGSEDGKTFTLYDLWSMDGDTPVRPFEMDFGYRVNFDVYADGVIRVSWSNSAFESGFDFYKMAGSAATPICSLVVASMADDTGVMTYTKDGEEIDETAFDKVLSDYAAVGNATFGWKLVTEA